MKMHQNRQWWEKPGIGIMYQIEARPGWEWNRNYDKFNASMMDGGGNLRFNGPFCRMKEWVAFSKKIGVDYHVFESKWHDGICYFNTKYTKWKTPIDYCRQYAEESKKAKIPYMFYYSNIFDHNPQFDAIQPLRTVTSSYIAMHSRIKRIISIFSLIFTIFSWAYRYMATRRSRTKQHLHDKKAKYLDNIHFNAFVCNPVKYEKYMLKQLVELIDVYECNGLWMDWYQVQVPAEHQASADVVMDFMKMKYPNIILTFNFSLNGNLKWAHYLSHEAHGIEKAWEKANKYRKMKKPWELVSPAARYWDNPEPRDDPLEDARMAAVVMACGGKSVFGMPSLMNGELHREPGRHLELLGTWYASRRHLFGDAVPMSYRGKRVPGVKINQKDFGSVGSIDNKETLIHVINFRGRKSALTLSFNQNNWRTIKKAVLEPNGKEIPITVANGGSRLSLSEADVDRIDTILRIT